MFALKINKNIRGFLFSRQCHFTRNARKFPHRKNIPRLQYFPYQLQVYLDPPKLKTNIRDERVFETEISGTLLILVPCFLMDRAGSLGKHIIWHFELKSFIAKRVISTFVNKKYLQLKLLKCWEMIRKFVIFLNPNFKYTFIVYYHLSANKMNYVSSRSYC